MLQIFADYFWNIMGLYHQRLGMPIKNPLPAVVLDDVHALDDRKIMRRVVAALADLPADFTGALIVKVRADGEVDVHRPRRG
jgi:hypothetical protein